MLTVNCILGSVSVQETPLKGEQKYSKSVRNNQLRAFGVSLKSGANTAPPPKVSLPLCTLVQQQAR